MPPSDPQSYVRTITQKSQSNFSLAFLFMSKQKREAMQTVYSFCRTIDDIVDKKTLSSFEELNWWQSEINHIKQGTPRHPISIQLEKVTRLYQIPFTYYEDLLKGVEMDLYKNRYQNFDELYDYCYYVASVVGLICLKIFGTKQQESELYAINLGVALQLTNILRDLDEDLEKGRVYLPQDEIQQFGYSDRDLHHRTYNQPFIDLMRFQIERAKDFYRRAEGLSLSSDWKKLTPAQIMSNIYFALLEEIEKSDYAVFSKRISLSKYKKIFITLSTLLKNRYLTFSGVGND